MPSGRSPATSCWTGCAGCGWGSSSATRPGDETEGRYSGSEPDPNESVPWQIKQVWDADDDTDIEYLALHILQTYGFDCNSYEIAEQWLDHVTDAGIYIANKQAWRLMLEGHLPPQTGSRTYNEHWYSIDARIGTEVLGAISPGLPQTAVDLAGRFGRITNDGFAVHAAEFCAAMYAEAFFEPNVVELVHRGLEAIPAGSRTAQVISDVLEWYTEDLSDGEPGLAGHAAQALRQVPGRAELRPLLQLDGVHDQHGGNSPGAALW